MDSSDAGTMNLRRPQCIPDRSHAQMNPGEAKRARFIRKKRKNEIIFLPEVILFNIFVRLPANVLYHRVRYVCRQWDKIVRDPYFIKEHLRCARSCLFIQYHRPPSPPYCVEVEATGAVVTKLRYRFPTAVLSSCDGLLLYPDPKDESILHIANPVTKKGLTLPPISWPLHRAAHHISCARPSGEYKVVSTTYVDFKFTCTILSLGKDCKWRQIDAPSVRNPDSCADRRFGLSAGGFVYWAHPDLNYYVVLDVETELFYKHPIRVHDKNKFRINFAILGDNLSCMIRERMLLVMGVWVLHDPKTGSWRKLYKLDLEDPALMVRRVYKGKYPPSMHVVTFSLRPVAWMNHGEVLVISFWEFLAPLLAYNVKTKVTSAFGKYNTCLGVHFCRAHVNSLVSLTPIG